VSASFICGFKSSFWLVLYLIYPHWNYYFFLTNVRNSCFGGIMLKEVKWNVKWNFL
jgi:hypothetical protein